MRTLLSGVTGQIGAALQERLQGCDIVAADRGILDLSRPASIEQTLSSIKPDLIVNAAAYTAVDKAEDEVELAYAINAEAPSIMSAWAAKNDVLLIHFSTDYVFNGEGTKAWNEEDVPVPLSAYGSSKLAGEEGIRAAQSAHLIVRTSWIYNTTGRNFLRTIFQLARERHELRVVSDQIGAPTSACVVANAVAKIISEGGRQLRRKFEMADGLVHLAARGEASWHVFALRIVAGLQRRGVPLIVQKIEAISSREYPTRAVRPLNSRLDLARLRNVFGIVPPPWEEALELELDKFVKELP